jgi:hypothetical protein
VIASYKSHIVELSFTNAVFTKQIIIDWRRYVCYMPILNELIGSVRTVNETISAL